MAKAVVSYDRELPEIRDRRPWEPPKSHLVKDDAAPTGWKEVEGRRPSQILLVPKIREAVDAWRSAGYPAASPVARRLFEYWFEEDHDVPGIGAPFRYHYCQREAIETLVWLVEISGKRDTEALVRAFKTIFKTTLFTNNIEFQRTTEGDRQLRRYVPEREQVAVQDLPPKDLRRYAFKLATGSGKTWVMAMAIVWARLHKQMVPRSTLSTNFLVVAPNIIVYQRLEKDFGSNRIFHELPLIPPEWKGSFSQKVILRGDAGEPGLSGNLFLTNVDQLHVSRDQQWEPINAVELLLGKNPTLNLATSGRRSLLQRVKSVPDLIVLNDEAHHVHDDELAWTQALLAIHEALPNGLCAWLDFSATPKDQNRMYFPWTVCDYPLAQAVEDRIVKAPLIVTKQGDRDHPSSDPDHVTAQNAVEKYGYWLRASVARWKEHQRVFKKLGISPVLFVMAETNKHADAIGAYFVETEEFKFNDDEVLVIHTDSDGEVTQKDLDKLRSDAKDIDAPSSRIRVVVSVMMLREGWDVRNVTVVLGLRPFTAVSEILPEQVIGRGLRLMRGVTPDRTQTLEVLGTSNLLSVVRTQLEAEGVGFGSTKTDPTSPIVVAPLEERAAFDITIPLTKPNLAHDMKRLSDLRVETLQPIFDQLELEERFKVKLKLEFATTETEVHSEDIVTDRVPTGQELVATITNKVIRGAGLPTRFSELYPSIKRYVAEHCFGRTVDLDNENIRSHLARAELQEAIAKYLARQIAQLTAERKEIEFDKADFRLSTTRPFTWRRDLAPQPMTATKTVFNFVATYNSFERKFAQFLQGARDVLRFAALGTTEQGDSGTQFRVDYLKPSGAVGFYHPDWVVVQKVKRSEVNWIIETKGRVWEGTEAKDEAIEDWCARVSVATQSDWRFVRINQAAFAPQEKTLASIVPSLEALVQALLEQWRAEIGPSSRHADWYTKPAYRRLLRLGRKIVPVLLEEMGREPDWLDDALQRLTGVDPVPDQDRGNLERMTAAWVRWGREQGLL